ncbi:RILP-like protein homolog isoform X2 [Panonychus citri]|uniref:RILP-like protein homolog isoform X2 n=1 Tax=Panonychus citri TaxID=50023 RepID=UPI0023073D93|nr:RILP-like protein homolog isoform X2 [Panonychus citri]
MFNAHCDTMDSKYKEEMSVEDVYELASEIGKEFEKIIDIQGSGNVENLMSKVIYILQHLEACCLKRDEITVELKTFLNRIYHLEKERNERAENRMKLDKELEQIEDNWRKENNELINKVRKLQLENQRLQASLSMYTSLQGFVSISESNNAEENRINESELNQLRIQCENQQKELASKDEQIDELHEQIEDCQQRTREVKKKLKNLENSFVEILEENLTPEAKANLEGDKDEASSKSLPTSTTLNVSPTRTTDKVQSTNQPDLVINQESPQRLSDKQRREMIKSRFSFAELREIIMEKNRLRSRVAKLEESLANCRCRSPLKVRSVVNSPRRMPTVSDDAPVQGPINKEPEEKLFPWKRSSKIVKFFPSFTWANLRL